MATILDLQDRGLRHGVIVDAAVTTASLADLERAGLRYKVEVASGITAADRATLDRRGLQYFVPVAVDVTAADKAALDRQGLRYAVQVAADIPPADLAVLERQGLSYFVEVDSSGNSVAPGGGGGAALLANETNGFAADFTYATDASRVAVKTAGVVVSSGLDAFFTNVGAGSKQVFDASGAVVWAPHNLITNSGVPVTGNVTTITGETYTVTVTGSGSLTASVGGTGVATAASPLTFVATGTSTTLTKAGTVTQAQVNRGSVATAYLATTAAARVGVPVDYDPVTHAPLGMVLDGQVTNLLLNSATTLSTQSVTVTAQAYTLSFYGTGTVTLSGVSTAGPLVGTGALNRVSLTFTPTAGSLTLTVSGTVSRAQLETGSIAHTPVPTWGTTQTRVGDGVAFLLSTIPALGAEYSMYVRFSTQVVASSRYAAVLNDNTVNEFAGFRASTNVSLIVTDGGVGVGSISQGTIVANTSISAAARIKLNDCAMSVNGAAAAFDTTVTLPTVTQVFFGGNANTGALVQFRIQKLVIVPRAWSNAELAIQSAVT